MPPPEPRRDDRRTFRTPAHHAANSLHRSTIRASLLEMVISTRTERNAAGLFLSKRKDRNDSNPICQSMTA